MRTMQGHTAAANRMPHCVGRTLLPAWGVRPVRLAPLAAYRRNSRGSDEDEGDEAPQRTRQAPAAPRIPPVRRLFSRSEDSDDEPYPRQQGQGEQREQRRRLFTGDGGRGGGGRGGGRGRGGDDDGGGQTPAWQQRRGRGGPPPPGGGFRRGPPGGGPRDMEEGGEQRRYRGRGMEERDWEQRRYRGRDGEESGGEQRRYRGRDMEEGGGERSRYRGRDGRGADNAFDGPSAADEVLQMTKGKSGSPKKPMKQKGVKVLVDTERQRPLREARKMGAAISKSMEQAARSGARRAAAADHGGEGTAEAAAKDGEEKGQEAQAPKGPKRISPGRAARLAELAKRDPKLTGGIQPSQEERAAAAVGVKRSFERAEALAPGEWERLKEENITAPLLLKIGRRGATKQLADACREAWRTREVVKLRVHDDKSARKAILPQLNLVLRQLEELSGGALIDVRGTSIWLYRGVDYVAPPKQIAPKTDSQARPTDILKAGLTQQGSWRTIGGVRCYETGSPADGPPLVLLPDLLNLEKETPATLLVADRIARKGKLWVVVPDLLGEEAWRAQFWPPESVWKNRFADWVRKGTGAWASQRDKVAAVAAAVMAEAKEKAGPWLNQGLDNGGADGTLRLGVGGIGWGSLMAVWAGSAGALEPEAPQPAAVLAYAPKFWEQDLKLADALQSPTAFLPSKYDGMDKLRVYLSPRRNVYDNCLFKRFGHCYPGLLSYAAEFMTFDPDAPPGGPDPVGLSKAGKRGRRKLIKLGKLEAKKRVKAVYQTTELVDTGIDWVRERLMGVPWVAPTEEEQQPMSGDPVEEGFGSGDDEEEGEEGEDGGSSGDEGEESEAELQAAGAA